MINWVYQIKDTVICNEYSCDSSDSRDMNNQDLIIGGHCYFWLPSWPHQDNPGVKSYNFVMLYLWTEYVFFSSKYVKFIQYFESIFAPQISYVVFATRRVQRINVSITSSKSLF